MFKLFLENEIFTLENVEITFQLFLALLIGATVGFERKRKKHSAGVKTHSIVCISSCLVMITGMQLAITYGCDINRLGAQVISGIGFIGAGTIIKDGFSVKGLTTAATLWTVACLGLAVGSGFYLPAIVATVFVEIIIRVSANKEKDEEEEEKKENKMPSFIGVKSGRMKKSNSISILNYSNAIQRKTK